MVCRGVVRDVGGSWVGAARAVRAALGVRYRAGDTLGGSGGARAALERLCVVQKRVIFSGHLTRIEFFRILPKV